METTVSDEELAALAIAADPDVALTADARPLVAFGYDENLLPVWYMPAPADGVPRLSGWRRRVALLIVVTFLMITAAGLCGTYGHVVRF